MSWRNGSAHALRSFSPLLTVHARVWRQKHYACIQYHDVGIESIKAKKNHVVIPVLPNLCRVGAAKAPVCMLQQGLCRRGLVKMIRERGSCDEESNSP
jgi:hypothetical protein